MRASYSWLLAGALSLVAVGPHVMSLSREPLMAGVRVYYGPHEGFARLDPDLIRTAKTRIDMAAYVLTEREIIDALDDVAARGVKVRIYLDSVQMSRKRNDGSMPIERLINKPNIELLTKDAKQDMMHLKAFQVDGRILRSGSANFSYAGTHRQDNDIILIENRTAVADFIKNFEEIWVRPGNQKVVVP